jgi:hypothetical protein
MLLPHHGFNSKLCAVFLQHIIKLSPADDPRAQPRHQICRAAGHLPVQPKASENSPHK